MFGRPSLVKGSMSRSFETETLGKPCCECLIPVADIVDAPRTVISCPTLIIITVPLSPEYLVVNWKFASDSVVIAYIATLAFNSNAGYCFVEFTSGDAAHKALNFNGAPVPNSTRVFKLNWASGGGLVDRR